MEQKRTYPSHGAVPQNTLTPSSHTAGSVAFETSHDMLPDARKRQHVELISRPKSAVFAGLLAEWNSLHMKVFEDPCLLAPCPKVGLVNTVVFQVVTELSNSTRHIQDRDEHV